MCRKDIIEIVIFDQFLKPEISQLAGCHLDRKIVLFGERFCIENGGVNWNSAIVKVPLNELPFRGAFISTKVEITMSDGNIVSEVLEQPRHHHAVYSATNRQKQLSVAQKLEVIRQMFLKTV